MKQLRPSSEAEMIAVFLQQEYAHHARYGDRIDECLREEDVPAARITHPNIDDPADNVQRRKVFARYRGYGAGGNSYLTDFPDSGIDWNWVALTPDELLDSKYIRYKYWMELSGGTRSPRVAAERILAGFGAADEFHRHFFDLAGKIRSGTALPPVILVSADGGRSRVILEGHSRITAFAMAPEAIPAEVEVILGVSPDIAKWDEY